MLAMPIMAIVLAAILSVLALAATPAAAADLDWQIVTGTSTSYLERQVQRWAADGYRVQAIIADAPSPTIVIARAGSGGLFRKNLPPSAEYRVLDPGDAAEVARLGADGFHLRTIGKARTGPALAVFERDLARGPQSGPPSGAPAGPHDYRSLQAPPAAPLDPLLTPLAGDGYRVIASVGDSGSEWLILERDGITREGSTREGGARESGARDGGAREAAKRESAARDSRVITVPELDKLEQAINDLASEGFTCDAVWNRPPKGFALFKGGTLMAALSRRRGVTNPAPHVKVDKGRQPYESGQLLAVVPYRSNFAFVVLRAGEMGYSVKEVTLPDNDSKGSWLEDSFLERLRGQWWNPIETAWATYSSGKMNSWVGVERREPIRLSSSSTKLPRREADKIAVPSGAKALPRGGGEPGDSYRAHLDAIARGDLPGAKALWTGHQRTSWDENVKRFKAPLGMGFSEKDLFKSMAQRMPTDPTVLGGWINGDRATIRIEVTSDGRRAIADIDLLREAGTWKIAQQHTLQPIAD
jgi:hypothetical protein